uniref:DBF4 zinc finger B n=1 Tax=Apteryx owenii TaxID=8824 RepID=A0A8B9PRX1_APTOW
KLLGQTENSAIYPDAGAARGSAPLTARLPQAVMAGPAAARPLRGKSFYLDVPSGRSARELAEAIRHLGGVTESFLSKEVSYVVSSSKEAKRDKARTRTEKWSNVTSEGAKAKSPVPSALISRGKELLQKVMKNQVGTTWVGFLSSWICSKDC